MPVDQCRKCKCHVLFHRITIRFQKFRTDNVTDVLKLKDFKGSAIFLVDQYENQFITTFEVLLTHFLCNHWHISCILSVRHPEDGHNIDRNISGKLVRREVMYVSLLPQKSSITYLFVCVCARACVRVQVPWCVGLYMRLRACSLTFPAGKAYAPYCVVVGSLI